MHGKLQLFIFKLNLMGNCTIPPKKQHTILGYMISRRLSTARWSTVYEGHKQGQVVAIKKIRKLQTDDNDQQWQKECQEQGRLALLANCRCQYAPEVYGSFWRQDKKYFYIIMEKCDESLFEKLQQPQPLSSDQKINLCIDVMQALLKLHQNNIIHLDLKPSNILLKNNQIKITDFGFSFRYNNSQSFRLYAGGTHYYSSPERLRNKKCNKKSDLWSLGIILIQIWTILFLNIFTFKQSKDQIRQKILKWKDQSEQQTLNKIQNQRIRNITRKLLELEPENRIFLYEQLAQLKQQRNRQAG